MCFDQQNTELCVSFCLQNTQLISPKMYNTCVSLCVVNKNSTSNNLCFNICNTNDFKLYNSLVCVSKCSQANKCENQCIELSSKQNLCQSICTLYLENNVCTSWCQQVSYLNQEYCVSICAVTYPSLSDIHVCVSSCSDCPQLCWGNTCVNSCTNLFLQLERSNICSSTCMYVNNQVCVSKCTFYSKLLENSLILMCQNLCEHVDENCILCPQFATYNEGSCLCQEFAIYQNNNNTCACNQNYFQNRDNQCINCFTSSVIGDGNECQCSINQTFNTEKKICLCQYNYSLLISGGCALCPNNTQYQIDNQTCKCGNNAIYSKSSNACSCLPLYIQLLNDTCEKCPINSVLTNDTCNCNLNYTYSLQNNLCICSDEHVLLQNKSCQFCPIESNFKNNSCDCIMLTYSNTNNSCHCIDKLQQGFICTSECSLKTKFIENRICVSNCQLSYPLDIYLIESYICVSFCDSNENYSIYANSINNLYCAPQQCNNQNMSSPKINITTKVIIGLSINIVFYNMTLNNSQYNLSSLININKDNNYCIINVANINNFYIVGQNITIPTNISLFNWYSSNSIYFNCISITINNVFILQNSQMFLCCNILAAQTSLTIINYVVICNINTSSVGSLCGIINNSNQNCQIFITNYVENGTIFSSERNSALFYNTISNNITLLNLSIQLPTFFCRSNASIICYSDQNSIFNFNELLLSINISSFASGYYAFGGIYFNSNISIKHSQMNFSISNSDAIHYSGVIIGNANGTSQQTFRNVIIMLQQNLSSALQNEHVGIFGCVNQSVPITFFSSKILASISSTYGGDSFLGAIGSCTSINMINCHISQTITIQNATSLYYFGFIGSLQGSSSISDSNFTLTLSGMNYMGTIGSTTPQSTLTINNSIFEGIINGNSYHTGMIVGEADGPLTISNSNTSGTFKLWLQFGSILVGLSNSSLCDSNLIISTANVTTNGAYFQAALLGCANGSANISNCTIDKINYSVQGTIRFGMIVGGVKDVSKIYILGVVVNGQAGSKCCGLPESGQGVCPDAGSGGVMGCSW